MRSGVWLAVAAAILFGSLGVFAKLAYEEGWNVPSLLLVRFLFAALTVLPFALRARSDRRTFGAAFLIGALGYAAITALYFPSIRFLPAAIASFLLYLAPAVVAILAAVFLGERMTRRGMVALVLTLGGLALLAAGAFDGSLSPLGVMLAAGSAIMYAITTVVARNVAQRMPWSHLSLGISLGAAASYLAFSLATQQLVVPPGARAILWAVGIGVIATGISLSLFLAALARANASRVSVISTLEPVSTLVLAGFVLGEFPTWLGIAGGLVILAGAALIASEEPIKTPPQ